eukprot:s4582_g3.t1
MPSLAWHPYWWAVSSEQTESVRKPFFVDKKAESRTSTPLMHGMWTHVEGQGRNLIAEAAKWVDPQTPYLEDEECWAVWRQMKEEMVSKFRPQRFASPESSASSAKSTALGPITEAELSVGSWTHPSNASSVRPSFCVDADSSDEEDGVELDIIVGPTKMAAHGSMLSALKIPAGPGQPAAPIKSHQKCLAVSDALRLNAARQSAPLSFGSITHLMTRQPLQKCRPCMFEQRPGRCRSCAAKKT